MKIILFAHSLEVLLADERASEKTREVFTDAMEEIFNTETRGYNTTAYLRAIVEKLQPEKLEAEQE